MIKKSFRLMLLGAFALMSSVFVACDKYDDDIDGLQSQIDAMSSQFEALKTQVAGLQSEINGGAVITNVTANSDGIVVTLSNGNSYTIKNGEKGDKGDKGDQGDKGDKGDQGAAGANGANGKDGKDGSVITIGENGNWFIDGVDTGKPSQGAKGDKGDKGDKGEQGPAGANGSNGTNGTNGTNGENGKDADTIYYEPCTDEDSENYGEWLKVTIPADGSDKKVEPTGEEWLHDGVLIAVYDAVAGTLTFHGVVDPEGNLVELVVNTGAQLTSLAIVKDVLSEDTFMPLVESYNLFLAATAANATHDLNGDNVKDHKYIASNKLDMVYRVNPSNFVIDGVKWSLINRSVVTRAENDHSSLLEIVDNNVVKSNDVVKFTARMIADRADLQKNGYDVFALKATLADGGAIVSDFAEFRAADLTDFAIVNINKVPTTKNYNHICEIKNFRSNDGKVTATALAALEAQEEPCATFVYNESIDLDDVYALAEITQVEDLVAGLGFDVTYKFEKVEKFVVAADGDTDQQKFVVMDENNVVSVDKTWLAQGNAAIGRTPAFIAQAYVGETLMAEALVKLEITAAAPKAPITIEVNGGNIEYSNIVGVKDKNTGALYTQSPDKKVSTIIPLDWATVNEKVYAALGLSAQQFAAIYVDGTAPEVLHNQISKTNKLANQVAALAKDRDYIVYSNKVNASGNITNSNGGYFNGTFNGTGWRGAMLYTQGIGGNSTATNGAYVAFDPEAIWNIGENTITLVYRAADSHIYGDVVVKFSYNITHNNQFPAWNPNYLLNETTTVKMNIDATPALETLELPTVQVTGKRESGVWVLENGIGEIFENYLVRNVGTSAVPQYEIALPGNHEYIKFELVGKVDQYNATAANQQKVVAATGISLANNGTMLTATQTNDLRASILSADPLTASETNGRIAVVKVTIYGLNSIDGTYGDYVCEKYVAVKFVSPFTVSMNTINLKTSKINDYTVASLVDALVIKTNDQDQQVVFADGKFADGVSAEIKNLFTPATFTINPGAALGENKDSNGDALLFSTTAPYGSVYNPLLGYEKDANGNDDTSKPIYRFENGEQVVVWRNTGSAFVNGTIANESVVNVSVNSAAAMQAKGVINITK